MQPKKNVLYGVITPHCLHLPLQKVTRWRWGLLPNSFGHLFHTSCQHPCLCRVYWILSTCPAVPRTTGLGKPLKVTANSSALRYHKILASAAETDLSKHASDKKNKTSLIGDNIS